MPKPGSKNSFPSSAAMEASCFLISKSFNKTLDLVPSLKPKLPIFHKKRYSQRLHGTGGGHSSVITCCNLQAQSPDDNAEPLLKSDWRSFRARLVAGEHASLDSDTVDQRPSPTTLGDKWAHPLHEPEKGCLLIATEQLNGVHIFERTVILLLSTGPLGPTGIILNRPSLMSIKETQWTNVDIDQMFSDLPLFFGGPLEESLFLVGPQREDDGVGRSGVFEEVMKGLYYGTKESLGCAAEMVKRNAVGMGDFRFFDGYCGWEKEQLKEEIRAGFWRVVACSPNVIGLASVGNVGLWENVLGLVGERKVW